MRRALVLVLFSLFIALPARAFTVPKPQGHVTDTAGKLTPDERREINLRLEAIQKSTGNHVIVFLPASLDGETIEDAAFQTFNAWKVGEPKLDNGVLLMIAPAERRVRIETGKGVGGELTDVQSSEIIRTKVKPALVAEQWRDAVLEGANAIAARLERRYVPPKPAPNTGWKTADIVALSLGIAFVLGFFGSIFWFAFVLLPRWQRQAAADGYRGDSSSSDTSSSWQSSSTSSYDSSSSSSASSSSDSSSSYGGYDGGGGSSGGGGASDSW